MMQILYQRGVTIVWDSKVIYLKNAWMSPDQKCAGRFQGSACEGAVQFWSASKVPILTEIYLIVSKCHAYNVKCVQDCRQGPG
eukprot:1156621-Pelagomonas_calceolata.AAC.2